MDADCNNSYCDYTREAASHTYSDCTDTSCNAEGCSVTREALSHSFVEWVVVREATKDTVGEKARSCDCGFSENEEIPELIPGFTT